VRLWAQTTPHGSRARVVAQSCERLRARELHEPPTDPASAVAGADVEHVEPHHVERADSDEQPIMPSPKGSSATRQQTLQPRDESIELRALPARHRLLRWLEPQCSVHAAVERIDLLRTIDGSEQRRLMSLELAINVSVHGGNL
jgi:hypothetical protein